MREKSTIPLIAILLCVLSVAACLPKLETPAQTADGWRTGSLEETGIDEKTLARLVARIEGNRIPNIHGILIAKGDKLVFERYFEGHKFAYNEKLFLGEPVRFDASTVHNTMSITKAVTAATVGIAIDQGLISSERLAVWSFFPEYAHLFDERKRKITIHHLLSMSSGLQWNEWEVSLASTENDLIQLFIVADPIGYILAKPSTQEPGSHWCYSGGDVNLLGAVFQRATGRRIDAFSAQYLFAPLGISVFQWSYLKPDLLYASGELYLRPRDLAKFGYLFIHDGVWNGKRVISSEWIAKTLSPHISTAGRSKDGEDFGYQWWLKSFSWENRPIRAYIRSGWGGQAIILFPEIDMLVVFTGGNYVDPDPVLDLVREYLLPAIQN